VTAVIRYRKLEIACAEARGLSDEELVVRLLDAGASRLTAERIVAIERGDSEAGRARHHSRAR
jgi:hypothetical protein